MPLSVSATTQFESSVACEYCKSCVIITLQLSGTATKASMSKIMNNRIFSLQLRLSVPHRHQMALGHYASVSSQPGQLTLGSAAVPLDTITHTHRHTLQMDTYICRPTYKSYIRTCIHKYIHTLHKYIQPTVQNFQSRIQRFISSSFVLASFIFSSYAVLNFQSLESSQFRSLRVSNGQVSCFTKSICFTFCIFTSLVFEFHVLNVQSLSVVQFKIVSELQILGFSVQRAQNFNSFKFSSFRNFQNLQFNKLCVFKFRLLNFLEWGT